MAEPNLTRRALSVSPARLRRLNLHQNPAETLHIRRLENGLERPCGRSGENLGHFSSLVGVVVIARKLTYGNLVAIPAIAETTNTQRFEADSLAGGPGFEPGLPESESLLRAPMGSADSAPHLSWRNARTTGHGRQLPGHLPLLR